MALCNSAGNTLLSVLQTSTVEGSASSCGLLSAWKISFLVSTGPTFLLFPYPSLNSQDLSSSWIWPIIAVSSIASPSCWAGSLCISHSQVILWYELDFVLHWYPVLIQVLGTSLLFINLFKSHSGILVVNRLILGTVLCLYCVWDRGFLLWE